MRFVPTEKVEERKESEESKSERKIYVYISPPLLPAVERVIELPGRWGSRILCRWS